MQKKSLLQWLLDPVSYSRLCLNFYYDFRRINFFEYQTLGELTEHFVEDYTAECAQWVGLEKVQAVASAHPVSSTHAASSIHSAPKTAPKTRLVVRAMNLSMLGPIYERWSAVYNALQNLRVSKSR